MLNLMYSGMMNGPMGWGMAIIGGLAVALLVLGAIALAKYVTARRA